MLLLYNEEKTILRHITRIAEPTSSNCRHIPSARITNTVETPQPAALDLNTDVKFKVLFGTHVGRL